MVIRSAKKLVLSQYLFNLLKNVEKKTHFYAKNVEA